MLYIFILDVITLVLLGIVQTSQQSIFTYIVMFKEETETMTKVRCEGRNTVTKTDQIKLWRYGHLLKWAADSL
jgi:hypothetical protein